MAKAQTPASITEASPALSALEKLIRARVDAIESFSGGAAAGDPDAIHDMRVACRRLQAIFKIFGSFFHKKRIKKFRFQLRTLIVTLGEVREYDVLVAHLTAGKAPITPLAKVAQGLLVSRYGCLREQTLHKLAALLRDETAGDVRGVVLSGIGRAFIGPGKMPQRLGDFLRRTIPALFSEFLAASVKAVGHPRLKVALHELRIRGKPIRYIMELSAPLFGEDFSVCYKEVKSVIDLLGEIHDDDVAHAALGSYLREVRRHNRAERAAGRTAVIPSGFLTATIRTISATRAERFARLGEIFLAWRADGFSEKLVASMARRV